MRNNFFMLAVALLFAGTACGGDAAFDESSTSAPRVSGNGVGGGSFGPAGEDMSSGFPATDAGTGVSTPNQPPPPEQEIELPYGAPEPGLKSIFVLNSDEGRVVVVDAESLDVRSAEVGTDPRVARTIPGTDEALVLNVGSLDVARVAVGADGLEISTASTVDGLNDLTVAPDGKSAIAWYNAVRARPTDPPGAFQEVTVVRIDEEGALTSVPAAVGFRPVNVVYREDSALAWIVTEQGVSALDVRSTDELIVSPPLPVAVDPFEAVTEREVAISPAGEVAVVRVLGQSVARLVPLDGSELVEIPLDGEPTDLDLLPEGTVALLTLRDSSKVVLLDIEVALGADDPTDALSEIDVAPASPGLATVTADGSAAVLHTTVGNAEEVTVVDLQNGTARRIPLKKAVVAVALSPDGGSALLLHQPVTSESPDEVEEMIDQSWGYSLLRMDSGFAKLELLDTVYGSFSFTSEGDQLYLLQPLTAGGGHRVRRIDLATTVGRWIDLASAPLDVRFVPAVREAAVFQEHPAGRITFIDADSERTRTLTGFDLNALVD